MRWVASTWTRAALTNLGGVFGGGGRGQWQDSEPGQVRSGQPAVTPAGGSLSKAIVVQGKKTIQKHTVTVSEDMAQLRISITTSA
jgi:hypothetical protein